jgi:nucleoside phosphorylase
MRIAIIAAMEREVWPLVRNWKVRAIEQGGGRYRLFEHVFENGEAGLICGGIGVQAARRATEAAIREVQPVRVVSVGFAGALDATLRVGQVVEPGTVINAADGARTEIGSGQGILVSAGTVADQEQKKRLAKSYGAIAVDMESAGVAQGALARGVEFAALKVISDTVDFSLPAMDGFIDSNGRFHSARFIGHVALRPWLWGTTLALARNSSKASRALCGALERYIGRESLGERGPRGESLAAESNQNRVGAEFAGAHTGSGVQSHTEAGREN